MSYVKIITSAAILGLMSTAANAQNRTINELPITYGDNGVVQAQYIKPGDVSPEEYQRLLDEADKVRTYRSNSGAYSSEYSGIIVDSEASVDQYANDYSTTTDQYGYEIQLFDGPVTQSASTTYANSTTYSDASTYQPIFASVPVIQSHTVKKGDTLYSLSKQFGVSVDDISNANGLSGTVLALNQRLKIPSSTATVSAQTYSAAPTTTYASTYSTPDYTNTQSYTVNNGFSDTPSEFVTAAQPSKVSGQYGVLPGDNLYRISKMACTSVEALKALNGIADVTTLQPGDMLKMPAGHCLN